ncbi:MAG: DnaJ C-terminal domain-containing protein [Geitlerinemataceae cyanobacterium]
MENFRDYYGILGVDPTASGAEVKRSFRQLARQYHPDLNPGDKVAEEKFKQIGEAYEILSDTVRRAEYDKFASYWQAKQQSRPRQKKKRARTKQSAAEVRFEQYSDFNSFLDDLLNRRTARSAEPPPPAGSRVDPERADAFEPRTSKAAYTVSQQPRPRSTTSPRQQTRQPPRSSRPQDRAQSRTQERPPVRPQERSPTKPPAPARDIEARLSVPLDRAFSGGRERIRLEDGRSLDVNMPAGIVDGQRIRLKEQGRNGGDLFLKITVAEHPFFKLDGDDVCCQLPISPSEAVLGAAIPVPTLDGAVKMRLPPGVQSGQRLRLPGKGFLLEGGDRGDQLVEVRIVVPDSPSEEEKALYEKLREIETFQPRGNLIV